jgi:cell division protease FtsH
MIKGRIEELQEYHGVKINKKMIDYVIVQASCFFNNIANPDRSLDFVDKAMAAAKIRNAKFVTKTDINKVLDVNLMAYKKMSVEDKTATAYHEAGHCIVGSLTSLNKIYDLIALSIMPTNDYLGVTVFDDKDERFWKSWTEEVFVDSIAMDLAGRVAEKVYTKKLSSGASADLVHANQMAKKFVTAYGMGESSQNRIYFEEDYLSEETNNLINKEVREILLKGQKRAEEVIFANMPLLKALVNAVLEKGILDQNDLKKIFAEYEAKCKC